MDDPKTRMKAPEDASPSMADVLALMAGVLQELKSSKSDATQIAALKQMEVMEALLTKTIPENKFHPERSVYTMKPDGTYYEPGTKPQLRCKTVWVGYELSGSVETPEEIELLNRLAAGEYKVTKADGSQIPFKVSTKTTEAGKLEEVAIWFPCKGEHRQNHMSMVSYCRQALGEAIPSTAELLATIARMKAELAATRAVEVGA